MYDITIHKKNECFLQLRGDYGIIQEMAEFFSFYVPGYKFMAPYKNKLWDGRIRLLRTQDCTIYHGLYNYITEFCESRDYNYKSDDVLNDRYEFKVDDALGFINSLKMPFPMRDYQIGSLISSIENKRQLILSPTGSGKSAIIYMIIRYLQQFCNKGLLIVPTISLVSQMASDFEDYGYNSGKNCHLIYGGEDKNSSKFLYISTWQSIYNLKSDYFRQFNFVIGDEAHLYKAKSLTSILEKCTNAGYRIGTTGTLDGTLTNKLVLEGLFGPVKKATSTAELINNKQLSDFKINCMVLKHPPSVCKEMREAKYFDEMKFIVENTYRNNFIRNLALSLKNNTLILFQLVEKHGKILYEMIKEKAGNRKVFFVYGGTDVEARERVREITETQSDAIIIASYGTFSTGVNIKNLHNVIFASPSKSRIRNLQSIGRVLRISNGKDIATLYDIADDLRVGKYSNHTLKHFIERVKIYSDEKFNFKIYNIELKG